MGSGTAWHLASYGHQVYLIDPHLNHPLSRDGPLNGSKASLGILMGYMFRRSSGRAWHLRNESMRLWPDWIKRLKTQQYALKLNHPIIQLAATEQEAIAMKELSEKKSNYGIKFLQPNEIISCPIPWPKNNLGAMISKKDGQLDPLLLQKCLRLAIKTKNVIQESSYVISLERKPKKFCSCWQLNLTNGKKIIADIVVICSAMGTSKLIEPLGYKRNLEPALGQAILVEINAKEKDWSGWPAVLMSKGVNLIPQNHQQILLGATLEFAEHPSVNDLRKMVALGGDAPFWLREGRIKENWYGIRSRPTQEPAPILETLEPGLILASAHYRNGILLTPATAEWVKRTIDGY